MIKKYYSRRAGKNERFFIFIEFILKSERIYSQLLTLLQILNYFSYLMNYSFNNTFASIFNF